LNKNRPQSLTKTQSEEKPESETQKQVDAQQEADRQAQELEKEGITMIDTGDKKPSEEQKPNTLVQGDLKSMVDKFEQ